MRSIHSPARLSCLTGCLLAAALLQGAAALADEPAAALAPAAAEVAPASPALTPAPPAKAFLDRALRIGPSYQFLFRHDFENASQSGTGLYGSYEFMLKPAFALGINLSYRYFTGAQALQQVGYGLLLKHYLANAEDESAFWRPFVEYGLLLQISMISQVPGSATSHDTRLSAGSDFNILGEWFFAEASYHYSRARFFDTIALSLDNMEIDMGWRYRW